jgi:hypothetical protein
MIAHRGLPIPCEACFREFVRSIVPNADATKSMRCAHNEVSVHARIVAGSITAWILVSPVSADLERFVEKWVHDG